jgi:hypothetical protein
MTNIKTNISVYCTCGERLYHPGSHTEFIESLHGDLDVRVHIEPCPKCCGTNERKRSSATKTRSLNGICETVKVGG